MVNYKTVILERGSYHKEGTLGEIRFCGGEMLFATLERPNNSNKRDDPKTKKNESSCIPEGEYICKPYSSEKYKKTWEVTGVKNRSSILFHSANCINDLLGCIGVGSKVVENVKHPKTGVIYRFWLMESSKSFKLFQQFMPKEGFRLIIISKESLCLVN